MGSATDSRTPIYYDIKLRLDTTYARLDREKITHWLMNLRRGLNIDDCRGGKITLGGDIEFDGSARVVYWSFIRPCLEDVIGETLTLADEAARRFPPKTARQAIDEASALLKDFVTHVYKRMTYIDQALRGKGDPYSVPACDTRQDVESFHALIDERKAALIRHVPMGLARLRHYCEQNPVKAISAIAAVIIPLVVVVIRIIFKA